MCRLLVSTAPQAASRYHRGPLLSIKRSATDKLVQGRTVPYIRVMNTPIESLLPHRSPFLFVDTLDSVNQERIVGSRTFKPDESFFEGHFPQYPVVPGVLLIESMAQCGGAGVNQLGILGESLFFLATVDKAKFRRQVRPGDTVVMEIDNVRLSPRMIKQKGRATVDGEVVAEAEWMCLVGPAPSEGE